MTTVTKDDPTRVIGEWVTLTVAANEQAEMLLCAAPYVNISIADEGDDCLGSRSLYGLDQLDDLRTALTVFCNLPEVEAAMTWRQERGQP